MKLFNNRILSLIFAAIIWICFTNPAFAARLYFSPASIALGQSQSGTVTVYVDVDGKIAYGVEGVLDITGDSVNFTKIEPAGSFKASELNSEILDDQLKFRLLADGTIEGTVAIVRISYTANSLGETELDFVTQGNFNTSLVAEDVTGANILTSASGALFDVSSTSINPAAICGDGIESSDEQCDYSAMDSTCSTGFTCSNSCVCVQTGGDIDTSAETSSTPTPMITYINGRPSILPPNGVTTPSNLPNSSIDQDKLRILLISTFLLGIGTILIAIQKSTNYYDPLKTQLKFSTDSLKVKKLNKQNQNYESNFKNK